MRTIKASEIGSFLFCQRAWWYREQGVVPENQKELLSGSTFHQQHGRKLLAARLLRLAGWTLLLLALITAAVVLTLEWITP
jgi:hypothetical protein